MVLGSQLRIYIFPTKPRCLSPLQFTTRFTSCSTFECQINSFELDNCSATHNIHIPSVSNIFIASETRISLL